MKDPRALKTKHKNKKVNTLKKLSGGKPQGDLSIGARMQ